MEFHSPAVRVLESAYSVPLLTFSTAVPSVLRGTMRKLASAEAPTSTSGGVVVLVVELEVGVQREAGALEEAVTVLDRSRRRLVAELPPLIQPEVTLTCLPLVRPSARDAPARTLTMIHCSSSALPKLALSPSTGDVGGLRVAGALNGQPADGGGVRDRWSWPSRSRPARR